jgi:hypothetical protein
MYMWWGEMMRVSHITGVQITMLRMCVMELRGFDVSERGDRYAKILNDMEEALVEVTGQWKSGLVS